jgi:hypothetical protein
MNLKALANWLRNGKMRPIIVALSPLCILVVSIIAGCRASAKPELSIATLSAEKLEVYGDFLDTFSSLHFGRLANQTAPLILSDVPQGSPCIEGIDLEDQEEARRILHRIAPGITEGRNLILVDPIEQARILEQKESESVRSDASKEDKLKTVENISSQYGFLTLSEIAFDKKHQFAVVKYLYFCGSHCKHGGTLVMEKVGTSWSAKTRRPCTMIVN